MSAVSIPHELFLHLLGKSRTTFFLCISASPQKQGLSRDGGKFHQLGLLWKLWTPYVINSKMQSQQFSFFLFSEKELGRRQAAV